MVAFRTDAQTARNIVASETRSKQQSALNASLALRKAEATVASSAQPLDSDLTAMAALSTTAFGRSLLTLANAAALAAEVDSAFLTPTEGDAAYQAKSAVLATLASTFAVGTWSPTLIGTANVDGVVLQEVGTYLRIGARVIGMFCATVDPTAGANTATQFTFTLPVASDFATVCDCLGSVGFAGAQRGGYISSDIAGNIGKADFTSEGAALVYLVCLFMYVVI